jgi:hypothetical protein
METFFIDFISDNTGELQIDEPIGYSDLELNLNQKDKLYGRDISFSGGEFELQFVEMRNHYLEKLLYYLHRYGFEAQANFIIRQDGFSDYVGEIDFATCQTDDFEYFKCKIIQESNLQVLKRRKGVKVNVFSDKDVDGNPITPLVAQNMLLLNKPVIQTSLWEQSAEYNIAMVTRGSRQYWINPCQSLIKSGVEDSYTFIDPNSDIDGLKLITAKDNLKNLTINLKGCSANLTTDKDNGGRGYVEFIFGVYYGKTFETAVNNVLKTATLDADELETFNFSQDFNIKINQLQRGESIWIFYYFRLVQSNDFILGAPRIECFADLAIDSTTITAESGSYSSITKSLRLIDVMKQVVKSISGLNVVAPRFEINGEFYDNRVFDGNLLRNLENKAFNVSLEDIEKSLPELNADYEIDTNGNVFFGIESDFYRPIESGFFDTIQFSEMSKMFNPKFSVNEFGYKYTKYQSLKENEEANSADTVHGESRYVFFNKKVENKKEVSIEWTRDAFLIEANRRKSIEISEDTASQDDDALFIIDTINTVNDITFDESTNLQHSYNTTIEKLALRSDGTVNFIVLGIFVGSNFIIKAPDQNAGTYTVFSVANNEIVLTKVTGGVLSTINDGARITAYSYTINKTQIPFTNYTSQGFSAITGLNAGDNYSNLRYTVRRNVQNYWQSYLATCNIYWKEKAIKNTWYKNNGDCTTTYNGLTLIEKSDIVPQNPILTPFVYDQVVFANVELSDFKDLQDKIRSQRGFIRTIDNNGRVIKLYPIRMKYAINSKELEIKGEEKFESEYLKITTANDWITINDETTVYKLEYKFEEEKVYLYDRNKQLLYNGCYWNNVSINGAFANNQNQLIEWLNLL